MQRRTPVTRVTCTCGAVHDGQPDVPKSGAYVFLYSFPEEARLGKVSNHCDVVLCGDVSEAELVKEFLLARGDSGGTISTWRPVLTQPQGSFPPTHYIEDKSKVLQKAYDWYEKTGGKA